MEAAAKSMQGIKASSVSTTRWWASRAACALAMAVACSLVTSLALGLTGDGKGATDWYVALNSDPAAVWVIATALLVAPPLETLIMAWLLLLMLDGGMNRHVAVLVSSLAWAALHWRIDSSGWIAFVPFALFSWLFVARRNPPHSDGFALAAMTHFFCNVIALLVAYGAGLIELSG